MELGLRDKAALASGGSTGIGAAVAFRPTRLDGVWVVYFMAHRLDRLDLRQADGHTQGVQPSLRSEQDRGRAQSGRTATPEPTAR